MPDTASSSIQLFNHFPGYLVGGLAFIFLAGWIFLHFRPRANRRAKFSHAMIRWAAGSAALYFLLESLSRILVLATPWSWVLLSLSGAGLMEGVMALYGVERKVAPKAVSKKILVLRLTALALVLLILAEPVLERYINRALKRVVVLLVDQSESMDLADPQRGTQEWIELGVFYGILETEDFEEGGGMAKKVAGKSADEFFALLDEETREALKKLSELKRSETVQRVLKGPDSRTGLLDMLDQKYDIKVVGFAASAQEIDLQVNEAEGEEPVAVIDSLTDNVDADWRRLTRLTSALDYTLENIPPDQLAGVVVLSDFRDTANGNPEAPVTQLANRSVPVYPVLFGSRNPRHDLAVTRVVAPESIFKGERLKAEVNLKLYGVAGQQIRVVFMRGDTVLDEEIVSVPADDDEYRTTLNFRDEPEEDGILAYAVRVQEMADEVILDNNQWEFQTAVSEDRTNVLLVDSRPRWEFRYLRNLFYGRDKSIHLQYVLTEPDKIAGNSQVQVSARPEIMASASRTFGDAEATLLPDSLEEWRKFDIIILGDVSPDTLTDRQLAHIETCVSERGAALIVIAGPTYMPHKFAAPSLRKLLPVTYDLTMGASGIPPEPSYHLRPTQEGRRNPMMQLGTGVSESDQIWENLPPLKWRYATKGVKPGASILAYAQPTTEQTPEYVTADMNPAETAARIREMNEMKERNNLIVVQSYGLGRVMMLNFDRTWRLRFRVGDTLHHRFWGRVATWGAGEGLRAGNEFIRLGTDAITYSPDEKIRVTARILQQDYKPVTDEVFDVEVFHDGVKISTHSLQYREQSQGMYDVEIGPFKQPGKYPIRLTSSSKSKIKLEGNEAVETEFRVATAFNPVELSEFSADRETAMRIARTGNGELISITQLDKLTDAFGPGSKEEPERADITLWDHWILFCIIVSILTAEWLLRKKGGLL